VELLSNLVWLIVALILMGICYFEVRRGAIRLSMRSALTLTLFLCFILLPVISISDDLLVAQQAALPLADQTWRLAVGDLSVLVAAVLLLLFLFVQLRVVMLRRTQWVLRPLAGQLVRSLKLRPPPLATC
jgi:hypothetical protein